MNNSTYTPQAGSLADRVCAYFLDNPSDELEPFQIVNKFGVSNVYNVKAQLAKAVDAGLLVIAHDSLGEAVYGPGIKIDGLKPPAAAPTPAPAPMVKAGKHMPAKKGNKPPVDEDYSTPYKPPVQPVAQKTESVLQNQQPVAQKTESVLQNQQPVAQKTESVLQNQQPATQEAVLSIKRMTFDDYVIEDNIPMPVSRKEKAHRLLASLKPGQSVKLSMSEYDVMNKVKTDASKSKQVKFRAVTYPQWYEFRIWRAA